MPFADDTEDWSTYSAEGIAKTRLPSIGEGIGLAEDEGELVLGEKRGLVDLFSDGGDDGAVIHEGVLESYSGCSGAANVAVRVLLVSGMETWIGVGGEILVRGDQGNIVVGIQAVLPRNDRVETVACACKAGRDPLVVRKVWTGLSHDELYRTALTYPFVDVVLFVPACGSDYTLGRCLVQVGLIS